MPGRLTVRLADGSGDYYVTLTLYRELHYLVCKDFPCLSRTVHC